MRNERFMGLLSYIDERILRRTGTVRLATAKDVPEVKHKITNRR